MISLVLLWLLLLLLCKQGLCRHWRARHVYAGMRLLVLLPRLPLILTPAVSWAKKLGASSCRPTARPTQGRGRCYLVRAAAATCAAKQARPAFPCAAQSAVVVVVVPSLRFQGKAS